ncbi:MAG: hypothetical protein ACR2PH_03585 [Desulfobulbia bacterium]
MTFEKLKKQIEAYYKFTYTKGMSKYGAGDSEPRWVFADLMKAALEGKSFPKEINWHIYTSVNGCEQAAKKMTERAKKVFEALQNAPYKETVRVCEYYRF